MTRLTSTSDLIGTIHYLSPEQSLLPQKAGKIADVYGLAASLYFAISGVPPFFGVHRDDYLRRLRTERPESLTRRGCDVPPAVNDVILEGLEPDYTRRPNLTHFGRLLRRLLAT